MKKLFFAFAACAAMALALNTATAGTEMSGKDKQVTAAAAPELCNWGGFYIGGNAGANWNEFDFTGYDVDFFGGEFTAPIRAQNGRDEVEFIGGGQVGYLFQFNRWVLGAEVDIQGMGDVNRGTHDTRNFIRGIFQEKSTREANTDWMGSVRLRAGYCFGPILLYATGGVAFADTTVTGRDTQFFFGGGDGTTRSEDSNTSVGWTVGGGLDWQALRWLRLGVEYRHSEFDGDSYSFTSNNGITPGSTDVGLVNDQVVVKANIPFAAFFGGR